MIVSRGIVASSQTNAQFQGLAATHNAICDWWVEIFIAVRFLKNLRQKFQPSGWSIYAAPPPSFSMLNVVRRSVMRVKKSTKTDFNAKFRERTQHWKGGGGCVSWFKMFVITKDIEHKNVKRQVLEPLPANVPLKKSQPIRRQVRFDCLQNLESWWLFQHWQGGRGAVILRFRLAGPYWQSVYIITCFYICHFR